MNRRSSIVTLALLAAWVGSACSKPSADEAPPPADRPAKDEVCGRIVFVSSQAQGLDHIAVVAAAGGPSAELIRDETSIFPAAISPDAHSLLALRSSPLLNGKTHDRFALVALQPDVGSGTPAEIGPEGAALRNPSWSPDGGWIVFESDADSFRDLYRLDVKSDALLRLTNDPEGNFEPAVSPDGQRIAFVSSRDGNAEIYVMTADGGAPTRVTNSPGDDTAPVWSPDGQTIAFRSARAKQRGIDVFMTDLAGTKVQPVLGDDSRKQRVITNDLAYSPDGSLLAFSELVPKTGSASIVIVRPATGQLVARTDAPGVDEQPSWSPDGQHLVFARSHDQRSDIARIRFDASELELLTDGKGVYWLPRWVADPECPRVAPPVPPAAGQG